MDNNSERDNFTSISDQGHGKKKKKKKKKKSSPLKTTSLSNKDSAQTNASNASNASNADSSGGSKLGKVKKGGLGTEKKVQKKGEETGEKNYGGTAGSLLPHGSEFLASQHGDLLDLLNQIFVENSTGQSTSNLSDDDKERTKVEKFHLYYRTMVELFKEDMVDKVLEIMRYDTDRTFVANTKGNNADVATSSSSSSSSSSKSSSKATKNKKKDKKDGLTKIQEATLNRYCQVLLKYKNIFSLISYSLLVSMSTYVFFIFYLSLNYPFLDL